MTTEHATQVTLSDHGFVKHVLYEGEYPFRQPVYIKRASLSTMPWYLRLLVRVGIVVPPLLLDESGNLIVYTLPEEYPGLPRRPGDVLKGVALQGSGITKVQVYGGGCVVHEARYDRVVDVPEFQPCAIEWPVYLLEFHDLDIRVNADANSQLVIRERWAAIRPEARLDKDIGAELDIPPDALYIPDYIKRIVLKGGMIGTSHVSR